MRKIKLSTEQRQTSTSTKSRHTLHSIDGIINLECCKNQSTYIGYGHPHNTSDKIQTSILILSQQNINDLQQNGKTSALFSSFGIRKIENASTNESKEGAYVQAASGEGNGRSGTHS